ncbi:MAG: rhodanese-like domain-containing protein [Nitrospinota bacterium]
MDIQQITPEEAHRRMNGDSREIYIDVRSIPEFTRGHPEGAINIPLLHFDPAGAGMVENPDFLKVVEANVAKEAKLVIGCQMGPRSQRAAEVLSQAGYPNVANVQGGFGGLRDQDGRTLAKGWAELGLPVSLDNGEGVSYESLAAKAQG